jgi:hypothetical protein
MAVGFLSLPAEIRLRIYGFVFNRAVAVHKVKRRGDDNYPMLPADVVPLQDTQRGAQLLRVCRTIFSEAQSILYGRTTFHVVVSAFAGRVPSTVTDCHPSIHRIQHLIWQLDCDLLKHFYPDDIHVESKDLSELMTLELRFRADTWRDSFMGEWCDREAFVKGKAGVIEYAQLLQKLMVGKNDQKVSLIENQRELERGRVILKLERTQRALLDNVSQDRGISEAQADKLQRNTL